MLGGVREILRFQLVGGERHQRVPVEGPARQAAFERLPRFLRRAGIVERDGINIRETCVVRGQSRRLRETFERFGQSLLADET